MRKTCDLGYLPDDLTSAAPASRPPTRSSSAATYGLQLVETRRIGRQVQVISTERQPVAGSSLRLTIDTKVQEEAEKALELGHAGRGPEARASSSS